MKKGTIVFLAANASYSHTNLAGWYLRSYAESSGWRWHEIETVQTDSIFLILRRVLNLKPDILAASFYLFNHRFLISFLKRFKVLLPDCVVIAGGPEFLGDNRVFLEQNREINAVIRGEGEQAFAAWLACWNKPGQWRGIKGVCALIDGEYIDNGTAEKIKNLDEIPSPFHDNLMVGNFNKAGMALRFAEQAPSLPRLSGAVRCPKSGCLGETSLPETSCRRPDPRRFKKPFLLMETSRGCANTCAFCTSAGEKLRCFSLERVGNDLALMAAAGIREIRLADRTFNENQKRCLELLKIMREKFAQVNFHLEIDPAKVSNEMIKEFSEAREGKFHLETGLQTTQSRAMKAIGRHGSMERSISVLKQLCQLRNIDVHVDLIAGLPEITLEDVYEDVRLISLMKPAEIQLEILKILPGTPLDTEKAKWQLECAMEPPYEVLHTPAMGFDDIVKSSFLSNLVDWFYNAPELAESFLAAIEQIPAFLRKFVDFYESGRAGSNTPSVENRFRLLEQFCRSHYPALIPKLGYEWLKWGLSAQNGIYQAKPWKGAIPENAAFVEGQAGGEIRRVYLAELERPYFFVYGPYPKRGASAVYAMENMRCDPRT
jgi:radical SAM superfamily enzyme YgiQ (UPF0313 family)